MKSIPLCCICIVNVFIALSMADSMLGKGEWKVKNVMLCPQHEKYECQFDISRHKINRTHDVFDAEIDLKKTIDDSFAIRIDVCKYVDGGCKPYQVLADDSFCNFANKYAKDNMEKALLLAGMEDNPNCPINKGKYRMEDFMFDYGELPEDAVYGTFGAEAYIIENNIEIGCVQLTLEFTKVEEDD